MVRTNSGPFFVWYAFSKVRRSGSLGSVSGVGVERPVLGAGETGREGEGDARADVGTESMLRPDSEPNGMRWAGVK